MCKYKTRKSNNKNDSIIFFSLFKSYPFICQKWLATDKGDGMISREIPALDNKALRLAATRESTSKSSSDYALETKRKFSQR